MRIMIKYVVFILVFLSVIIRSSAQENFAENISTSISDDGKLLISYDITPDIGGGLFSVIMMVTTDGKQIKASAAYGDIGSGISAGKEKAIVWYYEDDYDGDIKNVNVNIFAYKENEPVAVFQILSQSNNGYAPCEVAFINNSAFANEYQWNFGDPSSGPANLSFDKDPKHTYQTGGIYSISLTARNTRLNLENTYYHSIEIKKFDPVVAGFEIKGNNQMPKAKVDFKNTSVNADTYLWNFGDPSSGKKNRSDKENPNHQYKQSGTFEVQLIVKNNFSGLSDTAVGIVTVGEEKVAEAGFIYTKSSETVPLTVVLKNTSENAARYEWDFGDPGSGRNNKSDETDPAHTYTKPGTYKIELKAWASGAKKPGTYSENITVNDLPKPPEAKFSIQNNNVLGPATIMFNNSSVNADEFLWDFGDPDSGSENSSKKENPTHTYRNPGKYEVVLTASGKGFTNKSTATDYVVITGPSAPAVKPAAKFVTEKSAFTLPASVTFKNMSADADLWEWDFGDPESAVNTSNEANPTHQYTKAGTYKVVLKVTNKSSGIADSFSEVITISAPAPGPVADFDIENNNTIAPARIVFRNKSQNANSYSWNFGDPSSGNLNSSTAKDTEHIFENPGEYKVVLDAISKESGGRSTTEKLVVVVKPAEPPVAGFDVITEGEYAPARIDFKNLSANADSYKWNFGDFDSDENESSDESPEHLYKIPGKYIITLEAFNSKLGKSHKTTREITLKSNFSTFIKSEDLKGNPENVYAPVKVSDDEFLILTNTPGKGSNILKVDEGGKISGEKKLDYTAYGITPLNRGNEFMIIGTDGSGKLLLQGINSRLAAGNQVMFQLDKVYSTVFGAPKLALSRTDEIGVIANTLNDRYPIDILFQKADNSGRIMPLLDRTFKYVGTKLATDIVATEDGGFALTGYWQENEKAQQVILFGKVDRKGTGEIHLLRSEVNAIGCDIEESYQGGYAVLRAREGLGQSNFYEISFILIAADGGPTDCATLLPCTIKKEDMSSYLPVMIKAGDGYVIASHHFNGFDYDAALYWIDRTGEVLSRYENISLPGDQFVRGLIQTSDGGFLVTGTQTANNRKSGFIIKTDPYGKLYDQ